MYEAQVWIPPGSLKKGEQWQKTIIEAKDLREPTPLIKGATTEILCRKELGGSLQKGFGTSLK